jgi:hypothetical protein
MANLVVSSTNRKQKETASPNGLAGYQNIYTPPLSPKPPDGPHNSKTNAYEARREFDSLPSRLFTPPTNPPRMVSNLMTVEERAEEQKGQLTSSMLKNLLGLENWRCGGLKLDKHPCRNQIPEKRRKEINTQIDAMIKLTRSAPGLEEQLEKLVMLVHCECHDHGNSKEDRHDAWRTVFPEGAIKYIEPVDKRIRAALGRAPTQCVGIAPSTGQRCRNRIGGQKVQNYAKTVKEIVRPEVYLNDANLDRLLKVLEVNMYCHLHVGKAGSKSTAWRSSVLKIREETDLDVVQSIESGAPEELQSQIRYSDVQRSRPISSKDKDLVLQNRGLQTPRYSRTLSPEFDRDPLLFYAKSFDMTPFHIISRSENLAEPRSSHRLIQTEMARKLDENEQGEGFVYLYEVKGNKGFVKIGFTSRTVATRHNEWSFACNRNSDVLYPTSALSTVVVPNARRVEALCHAELSHRRIRIYCDGCLKQHIEWFEASAEEAIVAIQRWSKWMMSHPYQSTEVRSGKIWTLKEEERRRIRRIDQFMEETSVVPD